MATPIDMHGKRYGKLTVVSFYKSRKRTPYSKKPSRFWKCLCDCGNTTLATVLDLRRGNTVSCGCYRPSKTHGLSKTPEYVAWADMLQRCENKNNLRYKDYGGRGISVCEQWHSFEKFFGDMGQRPSKNHSIDRINNEGGYGKENCRWATRSQQQLNRRGCKTK